MKDPILLAAISLAEQGIAEVGVVVVVGGVWVSGIVVPYDQYMKHSLLPEPQGQLLREALDAVSSRLPRSAEGPDSDVAQEEQPNYLHLRDAKSYTPGISKPTPMVGCYWRVRLEAIDGLAFGTMKIVPDALPNLSIPPLLHPGDVGSVPDGGGGDGSP